MKFPHYAVLPTFLYWKNVGNTDKPNIFFLEPDTDILDPGTFALVDDEEDTYLGFEFNDYPSEILYGSYNPQHPTSAGDFHDFVVSRLFLRTDAKKCAILGSTLLFIFNSCLFGTL